MDFLSLRDPKVGAHLIRPKRDFHGREELDEVLLRELGRVGDGSLLSTPDPWRDAGGATVELALLQLTNHVIEGVFEVALKLEETG